ncbi:MAG TPA: hypothetical protein VF681_15940 [Abditibacteriaceae bacterium]|jgi:hypothetical protein
MKRLFLVAVVLSPLAVQAQPTAPPVANATAKVAPIPVVPGKSVGKVWLGAPRGTVRHILGKPSTIKARGDNLTVDEWLGPEVKDSWNNISQRRFAVVYRHERAVQIEFNSPSYRTSQGISTNSSLGEFRKFFRPRLRAYLYTEGGGGFRYYAYDDRRRGLAFAFGGQDSYDARVLPEILVVHRRGAAMIVNPGGEPGQTSDEIPVQK